MKAPVAKKIPKRFIKHGDKRVDPYFWMRDRENPEVIKHLEKENAYTRSVLKTTGTLQKDLFREMKGRIKEDDSSAPYFKNGYWYYERYKKGKQHPLICRKKGALNAREDILIDENLEAKKHPYYEITGYAISSDNKWMAFAEDIHGRRLYQIRFKNLETGKILPGKITNTGSDLAWHNSGQSIFYCEKDPTTLRPYKVNEYHLAAKKSVQVYKETDDTFICGVSKSKDDKYVFLGSYSSTTTEYRFKSASDQKKFEVFIPRKKGHEYYPETSKNGFIIKTNRGAPNFMLVSCPANKREPRNWKVIQKHSTDIFIEDFEVFNNYIVVQEKKEGLTRLGIYFTKTLQHRVLPPFEETYTLYLGSNPEYKSGLVRIGYSSMTTPHTVYDINLRDLSKKVIKQTEVKGDFKPGDYKSERLWAKAPDGTKVPVSLVYKKNKFKKDGSNPLLMYGYGSYGSTIDPYFSSVRLSLLNRGFVFAIAHIRGGEDLGRKWYDQGRMMNKKNTFTDFIACTQHLTRLKYGDPKKVFAMGGSAGGLLMGAIANMQPGLWRGIVSQVPFVDVITTMLDTSIPLTTGEYDEWGNPNNVRHYKYIKSYSPYDNIEAKAYPAMLVTSGLHDSQVQYWEPTKYVAKLRELKTDTNTLLLHTNMKAGHGGASGRFEQLKEVAMEYAFLFMLLKKK
jgi:oligopeptidase B